MRTLHLGCDAGEAETVAAIAAERALFEHVSAVSIACGGHAGDDRSMRETVNAALARGLVIGAHPSYPDRASFGRAEMRIGHDELFGSIGAQIIALREICEKAGASVSYVKPHGALYHAVSRDERLSRLLAEAVQPLLPGCTLVAPLGSASLGVWSSMGVPAWREGFADRGYTASGALIPRSDPGALITDPHAAGTQAVRLAENTDILCVHGDSPGAASLARGVRLALGDAGHAVGHC